MKLIEITDWLKQCGYSYQLNGDPNHEIVGFSSLERSSPGKLTWIKKQEYYDRLTDDTCVSCAVIQTGVHTRIANQIVAENSKEVFFSILHHFWGSERTENSIGKGNVISDGVIIDPTASIGNNCSLIGKIAVGRNTVIENNVVICNAVKIGNDCIIHSGTVIGTDGYGYAFNRKGIPVKVEHFGGVRIGDRVEIGANTCIDRGTIDDTTILDDVKIDNLVHIAHNVTIEKGAMVVAGAIICGSAHISEEAYIAPGGIVKNQLTVGESALVGMGAVVTHAVDPGSVVAGIPAKEIRKLKAGDK